MRWRTLREWFRPRPAVSAARYVQNTIPKWDKSHFIADYRRPSRAQWRTSWTLPRRSENTVNVQTLMWYFVIIVELRRGENVNYSNIQLTVLTSICLFPADCSTAAPLLTSTSSPSPHLYWISFVDRRKYLTRTRRRKHYICNFPTGQIIEIIYNQHYTLWKPGSQSSLIGWWPSW